MLLKGLDAYGEFDKAHAIGKNYVDAMVQVYNESNTVFENYSSGYKNGKPIKGDPAKADFVGWSGIGPISVLFEYVFGIKPHAEQNRILWDVELLEKHGVEKYPFGKNGELTLVCEARSNACEMPRIRLESNVPVEVEVIWGESGKKQSMVLRK
jgi:hypothetical protein